MMKFTLNISSLLAVSIFQSESESCSVMSDSLWPHGLYNTVHGILQARILEWVAFPFSRGSFNPGIEPRSPTLQADFCLPAEPQEKPKNTGVGSLSLLQGIFPTQESNQGLLHCRQIFYQLSYQGGQTYSNPPAILQVNVYFMKTHTHFNTFKHCMHYKAMEK